VNSFAHAPVGVFDSGVGGLTVLKALEAALPDEHFIYLGDTARLPYGTKSPRTIERYAVQAARVLVERGIKALVVACNTASAVALTRLRDTYAPVPVFGVVAPGAHAAARASRGGRIAVIGTESTVRGGAYQRAILAERADARIMARPCPLLVTLAEEGWTAGDVPRAVLEAYLGGWLHGDTGPWQPDCLVLGCTHFPILLPLLAQVAGPAITIVDSAETTAAAVRKVLEPRHPAAATCNAADVQRAGTRTLLATDDRARFARVGQVFLGQPISVRDVEVVDL
jgi:glutamate racemase